MRIILALQAGFTVGVFGFNEAFYALVSRSYRWDLTPRINGHPFYDTPPLLALVGVVGNLFGFPGAYRLPSIAATIGLAFIAYKVGGWERAFIVASTPWVWFWMGNNSTDPLLSLFCAWIVLEAKNSRTAMLPLISCLGFLSKQTFLLSFPLLWLFNKQNRPNAVAQWLHGLLWAMIWWVIQLGKHPNEVLHAWFWNATERAKPLGAADQVIVFGIIVAAGVGLIVEIMRSKVSPILVSALLFILFAIVEAPHDHLYYTLPGIVLLAFHVKTWKDWSIPTRIAQLTIGLVTIVLFSISGGLIGDTGLKEAARTIPSGTAVAGMANPQLEFYGYDAGPWKPGCDVSSHYVLCGSLLPGCVLEKSYGWPLKTVFLERCGA